MDKLRVFFVLDPHLIGTVAEIKIMHITVAVIVNRAVPLTTQKLVQF